MKKTERTDIFGDWTKIGVIFGLALLVRVIYLATANQLLDDLTADPLFFDSWARSILDGGFFPDSAFYRAPLYPYFLSILYAVSGGSEFSAAIVQAILGSISCVLIYSTARRFLSEKMALIAGVISALYGAFIFLDAELIPSSLAMFLLLAALFVMSLIKAKSGYRPCLIAGILIGLASITQPSLIVLGFVALLWLLIGFKIGTIQKLTRWVVLLAGMAIAILPVTLHNGYHSGDLILISSNCGISFLAGNNYNSDGKSAIPPGENPEIIRDPEVARQVAERIAGNSLSQAEVSSFFLTQGLHLFEDSPKTAVGLIAKRAIMTANGYEIQTERPFYETTTSSWLLSILTWDRVISFPMGILIPIFVVGLIATFGSWRKLVLFYCFLLSTAAWPLLFYVNVETRAYLAVGIIVFASAGIVKIIKYVREKQVPGFSGALAVAVVFLFVSNYDFIEIEGQPELPYLQRGTAHWEEGNYDAAQEEFLKGLEINPDSPLLLNNLANVYYKKRIYKEAEKKYRRALMFQPDYLDARKNLVRLYERWERKDMLYHAYSEFLGYFPNSEWGLFRMGEYFVEQLQDDSALVIYERLVRIDPENPDARFALANLYIRHGKADEARMIYEDMLQVYPDDLRIHLNLGLAYVQLGKELQAEDEFTYVLSQDSTNTFALYNMARLLESRGDSGVATSLFLKILAIDPDFYENSEEIFDSLIAGARRQQDSSR